MPHRLIFLVAAAFTFASAFGTEETLPSEQETKNEATFVANTREIELPDEETDVTLTLFIPKKIDRNMPAVIFLPGVMAEIDQYASYANALAEQGILVAMHHWYTPLSGDVEIAHDAKAMAKWLTESLKVDKNRLGIAGHSFGAKDAILAESIWGKFAAIVAIDPDNSGDISAVDDFVPNLKSPLMLIGAEVGWKGPELCAPINANYLRFFEKAPSGTIELTLKGADHVQMLDDAERFGYTICRVGDADSSETHDLALKATLAFFRQHLLGGPSVLETLPPDQIRVAGKPLSPSDEMPPKKKSSGPLRSQNH